MLADRIPAQDSCRSVPVNWQLMLPKVVMRNDSLVLDVGDVPTRADRLPIDAGGMEMSADLLPNDADRVPKENGALPTGTGQCKAG